MKREAILVLVGGLALAACCRPDWEADGDGVRPLARLSFDHRTGCVWRGPAVKGDGFRYRDPFPTQGPAAALRPPRPASRGDTRPRVAGYPARPPGKTRISSPTPAYPGVAYRKQRLGFATAHVVQVDLNRSDIRVTVGVARGGVGRWETWGRLLGRLRPTAAITGTYYDTESFIPVGTLVADGAALHRGSVGTALTFTAANRARITRDRIARGEPGVQTALRAGPRLIARGRLSLAPAQEGFRDPGVFARKPRAAVGLTKQNKLLLVTVTKPLYLREMARVMRELGAVDAMCMDGGSSAGLYYAGRSYPAPRRVMTNVLMVYAGSLS